MTMNKKLLLGALFAALSFTALGSVVLAVPNKLNFITGSGSTNTSFASATITAEQAGAIAAADVTGTVMFVDLERKETGLKYEVDLQIAGGRAEVEVDAVTGKILSTEKHFDYTPIPAIPASSLTNAGAITAEQAGTIAANYVTGTVIRIKTDHEDTWDRLVYEVDVKLAGGRAEVEVDSVTGKILSVEYD